MPPPKDLAAIAAAVGCDVRTVRAYFDGRKVLPIYRDAIDRAVERAAAGEALAVRVERADLLPTVRRFA